MPQGGTRMKVLYIDDSPMLFKMVSIYLRHIPNLELVLAANAIEGIEKAKKEMPDVILLDNEMPGMDGEKTLKELKYNSATSAIPVIIFAQSEEPWLERKMFETGASAFLSKSKGITKLSSVILQLGGGRAQ